MKRAKIKRKKEYIPDKSQQRKIMAASYMVLAETFIYMHSEYGWGKKRCNDIIDAYWNTMVSIHETSVRKAKLTGKGIEPVDVMRNAQRLVDDDLFKLAIKANNAYILDADRLVMSCMIIALNNLAGFGKKRMSRWLEGYVAMVNEVFNPKQSSTVRDIVKWAEELTGINVTVALVWE